MDYYLARAVYKCIYDYDLIFEWCCLCGGTISKNYYYIKIKLSLNSGAATSGAVGRRPLKFGVRVRHQKGHGDPRAFRDCVTWSRARSRKHAFRACGPFTRRVSRQAIRNARWKSTCAKMVTTVPSRSRCFRPWS